MRVENARRIRKRLENLSKSEVKDIMDESSQVSSRKNSRELGTENPARRVHQSQELALPASRRRPADSHQVSAGIQEIAHVLPWLRALPRGTWLPNPTITSKSSPNSTGDGNEVEWEGKSCLSPKLRTG